MNRSIRCLFRLVISTLLVLGCGKNESMVDLTEQVIFKDYFPCSCLCGNFYNEIDSVIIIDYRTYKEFRDLFSNHSIECDTVDFPSIDFNSYILIGKFTYGGGCGEIEPIYKIYEDRERKKIIYKITTDYAPLPCKFLSYSMNWACIPKLPENYTVEFQVNEMK
jgi:hypothetical protein